MENPGMVRFTVARALSELEAAAQYRNNRADHKELIASARAFMRRAKYYGRKLP